MFLLNILWATPYNQSSQTTMCNGIGYRMCSAYDPAVLYPLGIDGVDLRPKIAVKLLNPMRLRLKILIIRVIRDMDPCP